MGDIVDLKPKEDPDLLWMCADCGCSTYRLYCDGHVECSACDQVGRPGNGEWVKLLPEPPVEPREELPDSRVLLAFETPLDALRGMMQRIDTTQINSVIVIQENSRVQGWGGISEPERCEWLRKRLDDAYDVLTMCMPKG